MQQTGATNGKLDLFLQPVASYNPFEDAVAQLARAIRLGAVPVGDKFPPERELAESLGVSRTTVREAIRGLEQAGYVTTRRGRFGGTFVLRDQPSTPARDRKRVLGPQLLETLDHRAAIEPGAAALAARKASADSVAPMYELLAEMEEGDQDGFLRLNCQLHIMIGRAADCAPVLKTVTALEVRVMDALTIAPQLDRSIEHSHAQHRAILDAIAAGDAKAARDELDEHLAASDLLLRELVTPKARR